MGRLKSLLETSTARGFSGGSNVLRHSSEHLLAVRDRGLFPVYSLDIRIEALRRYGHERQDLIRSSTLCQLISACSR